MSTIPISTDTAYWLAVYATRYALGRSSPAVSQVSRWVASIAHCLRPGERAVILRDLVEQRSRHGYGSACDVEDWTRLEQVLVKLGVDE